MHGFSGGDRVGCNTTTNKMCYAEVSVSQHGGLMFNVFSSSDISVHTGQICLTLSGKKDTPVKTCVVKQSYTLCL